MIIKNRFRFKLAISFLTSTIVPFLIMGLVAINTIYNTRRHDVMELEHQSLLELKERINKFLLEKAEASKLIVHLPQPKNGKLDVNNIQNEDVDFFMSSFNNEVTGVIEYSMVSMNGLERGKISNEQLIVDGDKISQKNLQHFISAEQDKTHYDINNTLKGQILTIAAPIDNQTDSGIKEQIGVNVVKINAETALNVVNSKVIGNTGYFLLMNKDGHFISTSDKWSDQSLPFFKSTIKNPEVIKDVTFYEQNDSRNQPVIIGETIINPELGWKLAVVWPKKDAFATIQTITNQIIIAIGLILLLILILSLFLSQQVVKPIELLMAKAALIGQGKLEQKIDIHTSDEIEELGSSFNQMAEGLQEIQKLKDEFVFIAAHELRTPVTAIKGYLSMMLDGDFGALNENLKPAIDKVKNVNEQLVRLVNDLLEIARAEAGRTRLNIKEVNLITVTESVITTLTAWATNEDRKLIYNKPAQSLMVMADEDKLVEILNNFGSNAIKYNRKGGTVTFSQKEEGDFIITTVQDTGIGMTPEELSHLFEKFYRAENEDVRKVTGTGLGLFVVRQLVEKMGGTVSVTSERGKGTAFSFSLKKVETGLKSVSANIDLKPAPTSIT